MKALSSARLLRLHVLALADLVVSAGAGTISRRSSKVALPQTRGHSEIKGRRPVEVPAGRRQSRPQPLHGAQDGEAAGWLFQVQVASRRPEPAPPTNCATRCAASRGLRHRGRHGHDPQTCQQHHHKVGRPGRLLQEAAKGGAEPWCETGPEPHVAQARRSGWRVATRLLRVVVEVESGPGTMCPAPGAAS